MHEHVATTKLIIALSMVTLGHNQFDMEPYVVVIPFMTFSGVH